MILITIVVFDGTCTQRRHQSSSNLYNQLARRLPPSQVFLCLLHALRCKWVLLENIDLKCSILDELEHLRAIVGCLFRFENVITHPAHIPISER